MTSMVHTFQPKTVNLLATFCNAKNLVHFTDTYYYQLTDLWLSLHVILLQMR